MIRRTTIAAVAFALLAPIAPAQEAASPAAAPAPPGREAPADPRWAVDPETLASPYGEGDERGALNRLDPESVMAALGLVTRGEVLSLAVPLSRETPAYGWRRFDVVVGRGVWNEDVVTAPINTGTQIDGLAHLGVDGRFYGGRHIEDFHRNDGLQELGIENASPIVTRGVALDIAGLKGVERLEIGYAVTPADIEAAMARQGIEAIREGDVVIFHTGHRSLLDAGERETFLSGQPGPGIAAARWLAARGVVAVGGDSGSMEAMPFEREGLVFPVHQILLAEHGIYILENIATERLAEAGWSEFLFVATPLPIVGASSSWVNPIAIR
ncbi:MAG: cyclase family protein [Paracoccaceae bacterium]